MSLESELIDAAKKGNIDDINQLIKNGAKIDHKDEFGFSAINYAAAEGRQEAINLLLRCRYEAANKSKAIRALNNRLLDSVREGNIDDVKRLLENGAKIDHKDQFGYSAITYASGYHPEIVELLLQNGANVDYQNNGDITPLIWASARGCIKSIKILLNAGANVNYASNRGETALMRASFQGSANCVRALLKHGADVNHSNDYQNTSLIDAAGNGKKAVVNILLRHGADVNHQNKDGKTALICAAKYGCLESVKALVAGGARIDQLDNFGMSALDVAKKFAENSVAAFLQSEMKPGICRGKEKYQEKVKGTSFSDLSPN